MKICIMAGNHVGVIGLLTCIAKRHEVKSVVAYTNDVQTVAHDFGIMTYSSVKIANFIETMYGSDLLLSIHGMEIVPDVLLQIPRWGGINIQPYIDRYKGSHPVARAFKNNDFQRATVSAHKMIGNVDSGEIIFERRKEIEKLCICPAEVFNELYSEYQVVISKVLEILSRSNSMSQVRRFRVQMRGDKNGSSVEKI